MANEAQHLRKLAVLIDADNTSPRIATRLFEEIATIGEASVRRIYGDFSSTRLKGWNEILATHAIMAHQNFSNTTGKNASDIALVIDAMDLLHTGRFDGFCLVSSDSDFTRLAARIREQGVDVFGFGEKKTPESFRQACKRFIYTENLLSMIPQAKERAPSAGTSQASDPASIKQPPKKAVPMILTALSQMEESENGYSLGEIGTRLNALSSDFDPRTYGCAKLVTLIEKTGAFEVLRKDKGVYVRTK